MKPAKLANLIFAAVATTFFLIAIFLGMPPCQNVFTCDDDLLVYFGALFMTSAVLLFAATVLLAIGFYKEFVWLRPTVAVVCALSSFCGLLGTMMAPFRFVYPWGMWFSTVSTTFSIAFVISASISTFYQKPVLSSKASQLNAF
ncbi:unnamed protein product [Mesocestoides corti]|uniref:MARVEL domain-containing protein n=1 Tax=Mesocestoides corti TaxID=53468 RepID=A0A0R3UAS6_MESCO|nr:unnamed protein product [Mesocestoides corti]